jgi:glycosyltransferase involved in cell wall biosynthesis
MRLIAALEKPATFSYGWLNARLEGFTLPRTEGIICITRYTQEAVKRDNPRTWLLPNAVDESFFAVNSRPAVNAPPLIICVGLVCPRKNQNRFIQALDRVADKHRFRLLFLGKTAPGHEYDDEFLRLVKARSWCEYGGFADRDRLRVVFKSASLLALPSLEDNCPMAVLEAMAAGVPVIGAKVGGVPDLIEEAITGLFCDPTDNASMAAAVEQVLTDPTGTKARAKTAYTSAQQRFHPRVIAQKHVEIYREVLSTRS